MNAFSKVSFAVLLAAVSAFAQTTTPSTTLGAALTATANTVNLASIANVTAGQTGLFVDNEYMQVIGVPSSAAVVQVVRNSSAGSGPQAHASGAKVWIGLTPTKSVVPGANGFSFRSVVAGGTCTRTAITYLPIIYPNAAAPFNKMDCDSLTAVWRPYLVAGPTVFVTDAGANNAITSPVGSTPAYTGIVVQVTLAHSLQAGANTFAYAGGAALAVKKHFNPATDLATAYVSTGVVTLELANVSGTGTWLDLSQ